MTACPLAALHKQGLMIAQKPATPGAAGLLLGIDHNSRVDSSIHMLFVPFDLAVFWINSELQVVDKIIAKSWRPAYFPAQAARYTLEMHPDHFADYSVGDKIEFQNA